MVREHGAEISLEEKKIVQLEMLKEIDSFCKANNIKYSLAFGTLLGAIRHKGFIPWDDDVDIMMPLPDMQRFKELFRSETMKYCDVDTEKYYEYGFSRIAHLKTYNKIGIIAETYGICIDLYPMVTIPNDELDIELFFQKASAFYNRRMRMINWRQHIIRYLPVKTIPGFQKAMKDYRDYVLNTNNYGKTNKYYIVAGPLNIRKRTSYDFDLFEELIDVDFENYTFSGIKQYDNYLTMMYGDYMTPPPEDQRHPYHGGHYYWR